MLQSVIDMLGLPEGYEFIGTWVALLIVCFVLINLLSIIAGILRQIGGFK